MDVWTCGSDAPHLRGDRVNDLQLEQKESHVQKMILTGVRPFLRAHLRTLHHAVELLCIESGGTGGSVMGGRYACLCDGSPPSKHIV